MTALPGAAPQDRGAVLSTAFAAVVAMWTAGYFGRLPGVDAPGWLVALLMLGFMSTAAFEIGRRSSDRAVRLGALTGLAVACINLLILGGLVGESGTSSASVAAWLPLTLLTGAAWGAAWSAAGRAFSARAQPRRPVDWTHVMAIVAATATFVLLFAGGLVTTLGAGLAVPDWPNSFGYAMFLYPISKMTGGIYYEHAHRLFGTLVGLTTLALAWQVLRTETRRSVKSAALFAIALVVAQGVLGGLRVTGSFTLSAAPQDLEPSIALALVHGVTGQVFFSLIVALAVVTAPRWRSDRSIEVEPVGRGVRGVAMALPPVLLFQIVLGALVRHWSVGVLAHVGFAVVAGVLALIVGMLFWGAIREPRRLAAFGFALAGITLVQIVLGFAAFLYTIGDQPAGPPSIVETLVRTAHQSNGALLLACSVVVAAWSVRVTRAAVRLER